MNELIGLEVYYRDYLGMQCKGTIVYVEPNMSDPETPWVYLKSEYEKENDKILVVPPNNAQISYADLRRSNEVVPTSEEEEENFDDIF